MTLALVYFPLLAPETPRAIIVGEPPVSAGKSMTDVKAAPKRQVEDDGVVVYPDAGAINLVVMDRMKPHVRPQHRWVLVKRGADDRVGDSLVLSGVLASTAICIRPTTLPLWAYLGGGLVVRTVRQRGHVSALAVASTALATA